MPFSCFLFRPRKSREKRRNAVIPTFPAHCPHGLQHLRHKRRNARFRRLRRVHATPAPNRAHSGLHGETRGVSALCEVDRGMIQQAGGNGCARLQRASASSGVAAPQGCGTFSLITAWSFLHRYQSGQQLELSIKTIRRPNVHCKTECILLQYSEKSLEWRQYMICPLSLFAMTSRK